MYITTEFSSISERVHTLNFEHSLCEFIKSFKHDDIRKLFILLSDEDTSATQPVSKLSYEI